MVSDLKNIRVLILDVDGVLTEGQIIYNDSGEELKIFNVQDGLGIRMLMEAGIDVWIVTGRKSNALSCRCQNLGIENLLDGVKNKVNALTQIKEKTNIHPDQMAFIGDDLPDIPLMKRVGVPIAVSNACETVVDFAIFVTQNKGGKGAVREVCETILKEQGLWDEMLKKWIQES